MYTRSYVLFMTVCAFFLIPVTVIAAESYLLDMFGENIEAKDIAVQISSDGSMVDLRGWDIVCSKWEVYNPYPPYNFLGYDYYVSGFIEDYTQEFVSVSLSGTGGSTALAYGPDDWWRSNPGILVVEAGDPPPTFPLYYKLSMTTASGQTDSFGGTVNSVEADRVELTSPPYTGSFRVTEHDFGQQVILESLSIDAESAEWLMTGMEIEIILYGKETESSAWSQIGAYTFGPGIQEIAIDGDITIRMVKYGLSDTEGIKLSASSSDPTPGLWSVKLSILVEVPDVVGMTEDEAEVALNAVGLVKGIITFDCSDTISAGHVIAQSPDPGTTVECGSAVDLVISGLLVPDVVGMTEAEAEATLIAAGLVKGEVTLSCDTVEFNLVMEQNPSADATAACGSEVDIVISGARVPDVFGMTESEAEAALHSAGLVIGVVSYACSDVMPDSHVIAQSPDPGAKVECGSEVDLVISSGPDNGGGGMPIQLDIIPNDCANRIIIPRWAANRIRIPVAIIGSSAIDVTKVVRDSLRLEGVRPRRVTIRDISTGICDVKGPDGFADLIMRFSAADVIDAIGGVKNGETVTLKLTGELKIDSIVYSFEIEDSATFVFRGYRRWFPRRNWWFN